MCGAIEEDLAGNSRQRNPDRGIADNMITYKTGDIFSSDMQTLVNPVNTVGATGKGLAKEFAKRYPEATKVYKEECRGGNIRIGVPVIVHTQFNSFRWILFFPTKKHWRERSRLYYIAHGLYNFVEKYEFHGIESIAFPMLGCGLGGLQWSDVKPIMEGSLNQIDIPVEIYVKT